MSFPLPLRSFTLWLTGLPCSGKSTLAECIGAELGHRGCQIEILDGDVLRESLCQGLGYSRKDRDENVIRIGWACALLNRHNIVAIAAAISPYRETRQRLRQTIPNFLEIYVKASLNVCIQRDVKGMYAKALAGEICNFTGIDDPYEEPIAPDLVVETDKLGVASCTRYIIRHFEKMAIIPTCRNAHARESTSEES